jgi:REP element-mobilizing transposase RayT
MDTCTYFVTICTMHRACLFGEIQSGEMALNDAGVVIDSWWHTIPAQFGGIWLDEMIVMPNHLHGVISLGADPSVGANTIALSDVIGWFKTRTVNDYGLGVRTAGWPRYSQHLWQSGFHEHIIRSDAALDRTRSYILGNPARWAEDEENPDKRRSPR